MKQKKSSRRILWGLLALVVLLLFTFVPPVTTGIVQLIYGSV